MEPEMASLRLLLGGDLMLGRGIDQCMAQHCEPRLHESVIHDARHYVLLAERCSGVIPRPVDPAYPWGIALERIEAIAPDLRIVNLETAITTADQPWPDKGVHYRMHPRNAAVLQAARLDACCLANNHVLDWGPRGLSDTLQVLQRCGIQGAGAGLNLHQAQQPARLHFGDGGRLLLFAWAFTSSGVPESWGARLDQCGVALLNRIDESTARWLVARIRHHRQPSDRVVVSLHWGPNWVAEIPQAHRWLAHRLIDEAAVDVVMGHSSHHPLPPEIHANRLILHGCGDLINDYEGIPLSDGWRSDLVCLYAADLEAETGALQRLTVHPFVLRRFQLQEPTAADRHALARLLGLEAAPADWHWCTQQKTWQLVHDAPGHGTRAQHGAVASMHLGLQKTP